MARSEECYSTQLIDGDGIFNATGIENFIEEVRLRECGLSYAVVSIMGPQSSDVVIEEAKWDTSKVRDKLQRDIDAHITSVRTAKLAEISAHYEAKLKEALAGPVEALLDGASSDNWPAIRKLFRRETEAAVSGLSGAISGFDMDGQSKDKMLGSIENYARGVLKQKLEKKLEGS